MLNIPDDINLVIPHQASGLAVKAYSKYGGFEKNNVMDIINVLGDNGVVGIIALVVLYQLLDTRCCKKE